MKSVAMVIEGFVYGVMLVGNDGEVQRAWIDPELPDQTICEKLEFTHEDDKEVMKALQGVLDVRPIPEVNVQEYYFDLAFAQSVVTRRPD